MTKEILFCIIGSLAFAVNMKAPKRSLFYICIASAISATIEITLSSKIGEFSSCILAMFSISIFSEIMARILKMPTTIILIPSTIPLLPGSLIYYTMLYAIAKNTDKLIFYSKATILAGLGIALGAVISSVFTSVIFRQ